MTPEQAAKGRKMGGQAVAAKRPPDCCPHCGRSMAGKTWHSYLGHLGLHGLANKYFGGDIQAAQRRLMENGWARQDPFPGNGAFKPYIPVTGG